MVTDNCEVERDCGTFSIKDEYRCWNDVIETTACKLSLSCSVGSNEVVSGSCAVVWL